MAGAMADYLSQVTADYDSTQLNIDSQRILSEVPNVNQALHKFDDGSVEAVDFGGNESYTVELEWNALEASDTNTIIDFFMDSSKADKHANTFEWVHPTDGNTYCARFLTNPIKQIKSGYYGIPRVKLHIEGYI